MNDDAALLISLHDTAFVTRVLRSAVSLYESVMDEDEDEGNVSADIVNRARDFQAVIEEGAVEDEDAVEDPEE